MKLSAAVAAITTAAPSVERVIELDGGDLVRHRLAERGERLVGRVQREVAHVRRVQAGEAVDLVRVAARLVAGLEQLAPHGVEAFVVRAQHRRVLRLERAALVAQAGQQRVVLLHAVGGDLVLWCFCFCFCLGVGWVFVVDDG